MITRQMSTKASNEIGANFSGDTQRFVLLTSLHEFLTRIPKIPHVRTLIGEQ